MTHTPHNTRRQFADRMEGKIRRNTRRTVRAAKRAFFNL